MLCPRCKIEMVQGVSLQDSYGGCVNHRSIVPYKIVYNHKTIKIIDCYKCPQCGHSDDGRH